MLKTPPAKEGDTRDISSIPGSGRSPGVGNGNPFQYSCLKNSMDHIQSMGVTKSQAWLIMHAHMHTHTVMIINFILPIKINNLDKLIVIISSTLSLLKTSHLNEIFIGTI